MIDNWFPTTVYYTDNNLIDSLDSIKLECLEILKNVDRDSHPFGESSLKTTFWHPTYGHIYKLNNFKSMANEIINQALSFLNVTGFPGIHPDNLEFLNMWVNLVEKHDYHAQHIHSTTGRAYLSGVFYVDAPAGATLNFGSPYRDAYFTVKPYIDNTFNHLLMKYECVPGRMVMFRSNVYHGYDSHGQDKPKISIPFNLAIKSD
jgi:uncharacterized protein (TIGR02466 family)